LTVTLVTTLTFIISFCYFCQLVPAPRDLHSFPTRRSSDLHTLMGRHDEKCAACGWNNRLSCPVCETPMEHARHADIRLDACRDCKGVWFDHDELAAIWNESFGRALERHRGSRVAESGDGAFFLMEALAYDPFVMIYGAHAAGHVLSAGAQVLSRAPEALGGAVEAAGEVAGSVFETIVEIISGLFG